MEPGLSKADENPHPHLNSLPEGEEITLPFKGGIGWGWVNKGIFR